MRDRRKIYDVISHTGLILAGANGSTQGQEDGILTALELSGLDLHGTQLAVLSACETGMGSPLSGEGVYGLRRALFIAGAETQLITLWKVHDQATRELMVNYYGYLKEGEGPSESLRLIQRKFLARNLPKDADFSHPYYWASFITSGQWTPLMFAADTRTKGKPY